MSPSSKCVFSYFAYGSNLLRERLHLLNPTAKLISIGRLPDYCLGFSSISTSSEDLFWKGCSATIIPKVKAEVWGCIWELDAKDLVNLDIQEGVPEGIYKPFEVKVFDPQGEPHLCRTYELVARNHPEPKPSPHYLDVIIWGAVQSKLPQSYIQQLRAIPHNGFTGVVPLYETIKKQLDPDRHSSIFFK